MTTEYPITAAEIRDGHASLKASDTDLAGLIAFADTADTCLQSNNIDRALGQTLKRLFVRHMATAQRDGGAVTSERAVSGASRGYSDMGDGRTGYLDTLKRLDRWGCVYGLAVSNAPAQLRSIGRRPERRSTW